MNMLQERTVRAGEHFEAGVGANRYRALDRELSNVFPPDRLIRDPLRRIAYGADASFYRLVPQLVVIVESETDIRRLIAACRRHATPVTFRAAGTSLSGQAVTDSVLAVLGDGWNGIEIAPDASTIRLQPGVIGGDANRRLARPQDWARPSLDQRCQDRRHRRQQRERHVLRHDGEQLPHARIDAAHSGGRDAPRHGRSSKPRGLCLLARHLPPAD
jgi:FAD binding domain